MMHVLRHAIRVCGAAEAAALDRAAIAAGTPGRVLMGRAGAAAAAEIVRLFSRQLARGALVLAGAGNNGGDGWVIARALAAAGYRVRVWESAAARTHDAAAERALALADGVRTADTPRLAGEGLVVDALLGTGATPPVHGAVLDGVRCAVDAQAGGACVVAVDLPTGVDASTGERDPAGNVVRAHLTVTFGTLKRGHLLAREQCGDIVVVDIGLPAIADDALPVFVDERLARAMLPPDPIDAHKGTRKRVAIIGGAAGMAGAAVLAARGALHAGAGLVKAFIDPASLPVVQQAVPQALAAPWPADDDALHALAGWADVVAIGPGLGATPAARRMIERVLATTSVPVVLDADALNVFAGDAAGLRDAIAGREALLTPHPAEMMRLAGAPDVAAVLAQRFDVGARFASEVRASVLLKGVPTVVSHPGGRRYVTATGTAALATGGSGDLLTGIAATLLAQLGDALAAGAVAAWAHGRAAELATTRLGTTRGVALDAVADAMPDALVATWAEAELPLRYPVLCALPSLPSLLASEEAAP